MRVLAIDPGNTMSAFIVYEGGNIHHGGKVENAILLDWLRNGNDRFSDVNLMSVEMIASYGMAVGKEVFDTVLWIGQFIEAWGRDCKSHELIYRKDVKLFHCGTVRATDANIRAALLDRYGPGKEKAIGTKKSPGPLYGIKGDEWSALAIAVMVSERVAMR